MKDSATPGSQKFFAEYEEPLLLDAEDLQDVAGGCFVGCSDGSCTKPPPQNPPPPP